MVESMSILVEVLSPVLVAMVAGYSSVTVAKLNKIQKDITTNHGTSNMGEAVDEIRSRVDEISDSQTTISTDVINRLAYLESELEKNHPPVKDR